MSHEHEDAYEPSSRLDPAQPDARTASAHAELARHLRPLYGDPAASELPAVMLDLLRRLSLKTEQRHLGTDA